MTKPLLKSCFLLLLLSLQACIFHISSSKYNYEEVLSEASKRKVVFFGDSAKVFSCAMIAERKGDVFMLNGHQLREALKQEEWVATYTYLPYCGGESCILPRAFVDKVKGKGITPLIILRDLSDDSIVASALRYPMVGMDFYHYNEANCENLFFSDFYQEEMDDDKLFEKGLFCLYHYGKEVYGSDDIDALLSKKT